ncbi:LexA family protein [Eikenella corrodens]|uniref:Helix-turn-helix domain-containing protein n=1 Tax=Eikenella corrodens TaxID=539 RepID=A0A3S9SGI6_EIKCO|nr:S24 family peptidase [Eikenella corrodens]AZR58594.1 helix-turn-helix domain-containing protein [Eikenella corrodens]
MKTLQERLKFARAKKGLSQASLAKSIGKSQSSIAAIEAGRNKETTNIASLAMALGVNAVWLETGKGTPFGSSPNVHELDIPLNTVPLISWVKAGHWAQAIDLLQPGEGERISTSIKVRPHTYALIVDGDSMEPEFTDGDIIIVEPEEEPVPGKFVIIRQNGDEATFKQLISDGGRWLLKPLNPRYPVMEMRDDAVFCGVVKEKIKRY